MALPFLGADSLYFRDGIAACAYYIAAACTQKRKSQFFSIPATGDDAAEEELNLFLRSHRAVSVQRELVQSGGGALLEQTIADLVAAVRGRVGNQERT